MIIRVYSYVIFSITSEGNMKFNNYSIYAYIFLKRNNLNKKQSIIITLFIRIYIRNEII